MLAAAAGPMPVAGSGFAMSSFVLVFDRADCREALTCRGGRPDAGGWCTGPMEALSQIAGEFSWCLQPRFESTSKVGDAIRTRGSQPPGRPWNWPSS